MDISEKDMVEEYRAWEETLETRNKIVTFVLLLDITLPRKKV